MKLKRTRQCDKCPWRQDVNPHDIPNGYSVERHRALAATIAKPVDLSSIGEPIHVMACHETHDAHCIGWLHHQLGAGNNIALRIAMRSCENLNRVRVVGKQHATFDDTLPQAMKGDSST